MDELSQGRDNNLSLLRFLAASLVVFTHAYGITGNGSAEPFINIAGVSLGSLAVDIFFVVSGFLITKSWFRRQNITEYLHARFMRIFPALWVSVAVCVFLIGPIFTTRPLGDYFLHLDTIKYLLENSTILIKGVFTTLPGVFESHPSSHVNSPLWTLPYELKMYLLLALFSLLGLTNRKIFLPPLVLFAFCAFVIGQLNLDKAVVPYTDLFRFIFFFFSGTLFFKYKEYIKIDPKIVAVFISITIFVFITFDDIDFKRMILALATPYIVIFLAYSPRGLIRRYNRFGDYSYGMYIYGFPIQQIVLHVTDAPSSLLNFFLSWLVCLILAILSWHYVEEPMMSKPIPRFVRSIQAEFLRLIKRSKA